MYGGRLLLLVGRELHMLQLVLLLVSGTMQLLVLMGGRLPLLVLVGGMCVVAIVCLEGVRLTMVTMSMLLGRSRA
jgi:hypothetical protein